jgi:hypothetical protein
MVEVMKHTAGRNVGAGLKIVGRNFSSGLMWLFACAALTAQAAPPELVLGVFKDDYKTTHSISAKEWRHGESAIYQIVEWHPDQQFFVARNGDKNPSDPGKWSRVDWVESRTTDGQINYEWAYCMSAYDAPTQAAARVVTTAKRDTPRTGCNGFPFTRMARVKFEGVDKR